ncbi:hypothetical protein C8R43DRAFT_986567 [Mycena crocata]|nr:hypothetical protein C8R43DRAFT_986567 [Mycena crocata]
MSSEAVRQISMQQFIDLNVPILCLVTAGIENALKEYASGVPVTIKFTEEECGPRYNHHLKALLSLQTKSPIFFADFLRKLYTQIVNSTNFAHLKTVVAERDDDEELDGVDFDALEASVANPPPAAVPSA